MKLKGKAAIVTGGAQGIGGGIVRNFINEGAAVVVADRNEDAGCRIVEELQQYGDISFIKTDVKRTEDIAALVEGTFQRLGRLDILVNNAGYADGKGVENQTEDEWNAMVDTNLNGYARCVRAVLPHLKESKGVILNTASRVGLIGMESAFAYCATKGGVIGMTKNLAIDLAQYGIRVNAICPGWIVTEHLRTDWLLRQKDPEHALDDLAKRHPLGRAGTPGDCGKAAVFLCSDDASFITGIALDIDGGITLGY